jgi:O-antigen/teichoic acid export membrane protein
MRTTLWGLADQLILSLLNFAVMLIVARTGDTSQLGLYSVANSVIILLLTAQDSLITRPYSIQLFKPPGTPAEHAFSSFTLSLFLSAFGAVSLAVPALYFLQLGNETGAAAAGAIAVAAPFVLAREFARRHGLANLQMFSSFIVDAVAATCAIIVLFILLWTRWLNAATAIIALGAGAAFGALWWCINNRSFIAWSSSAVRKTFWQSWSLGKWLLTSQLAMQMQGYAIHWLCLLLIGAAATGAYAAALSVVALSNPFIFGFFNLLMPKSVRTLKDRGTVALRREVLRDSLVLAALMAVFTLFIVFAGDRVMALLYPAVDVVKEGSVLTVLVLVAVAAAIGAFGGPAAIALQGMERGKLLAIVSLVVFCIGALFSWALVSRFGLLGAGWGLLATETVGCISRWLMLYKLSEERS